MYLKGIIDHNIKAKLEYNGIPPPFLAAYGMCCVVDHM